MCALHQTLPGFVPCPRANGKIKIQSPSTHVIMCDHVDVSDALPDPVQLGKQRAELHRKSVSLTGKYGFLYYNVWWEVAAGGRMGQQLGILLCEHDAGHLEIGHRNERSMERDRESCTSNCARSNSSSAR